MKEDVIMKKHIISWLLIFAMLLALVGCNDDDGATPVSTETVTEVHDLYLALSAEESNENEYELQESFRDDNFWYYIYYKLLLIVFY